MQDNTINLIIIDDSFDTEEKIVSTLRSRGMAPRSARVEDDEDLRDAISSRAPDLVLYTEGMELITLKDTRAVINETMAEAPVPLIAVARNEANSNIVETMRAGAHDLSSYANLEHLCLVIDREVTAYRNWARNDQLQRSFEESEKRCESLLDSSRDAIAYVHEGMHVYSNDSYLQIFGFEKSDDLEGTPVLDMVAISDRDTFKSNLRDFMQGKLDGEAATLKLVRPDGEEFDGKIEFSTASIEGEPCVQIIIRHENADSEELERQLKQLSQRDQLTSLFNRQYCMEQLDEIITDCAENETTAALLEIQLDNYDDIRKEIGVSGVDKYLIDVAHTLFKATPNEDILARYMHSSFTIITRDKDEKQVRDYAHHVQKVISDIESEIQDKNINTTCCIGATLIDKDSPDYNEVLSRVEKATQVAMDEGTNKFNLYVPQKGELTRQEVDAKFKDQLTQALKNDDFVLHFQPVVSLHGDTDERYEVFVRMAQDESEELIMPQDFLPAAERIGMAIAIDRWVLYKTITVLKERQEAGFKTHFFIKLSASSLKDETLIDWLDFQIKEKDLPANSLVFVVKENIAVTNLKHSKDLADKLHRIKCGFVLDDFGTGTNPMQLLGHINADYIRIEKSFMDDLTENTHNQEIIQKIAMQASEMGKFTIAQFVPDAGSLSVLWGMGVNFIQGYFLQKPEPELTYDFTETT